MGVSRDVLTSLREGTPILRDDIMPSREWNPPAELDIGRIRSKLGINQEEFARRFGFSFADVRNWEAGGRPDSAACVLLRVIEQRADVVEDAVRWRANAGKRIG